MRNMKVIGYWTSTAAVAGVLLVDGVMGLLHAHGRVMLEGMGVCWHLLQYDRGGCIECGERRGNGQ
jgi:hypothetical protein